MAFSPITSSVQVWDCMGIVSYTHLDVYKRQTLTCAPIFDYSDTVETVKDVTSGHDDVARLDIIYLMHREDILGSSGQNTSARITIQYCTVAL